MCKKVQSPMLLETNKLIVISKTSSTHIHGILSNETLLCITYSTTLLNKLEKSFLHLESFP
jgi:hypothetical protein